ncbi:MAG TPA: MXAN_5187 C-terminal domain-containing protein [Vicinamibacteria bacterium]|nr:MXAN_5187 C-terminal domain-containing protein [Vicinamibacteria bacterium]
MSFQDDMAMFNRLFKLLEREFEQWFSGALRKPPWATQKRIANIVRKYSVNPPTNLTEQSIFAMNQAKFNTYMEMWNRRVRMKEEGRLPTGREIHTRPRDVPPPETDEPLREVFDSYVSAKRKAGEATSKLDYESFRKTLEKQAEHLRESRGFKEVDFGVAVKNGKVSVVARPKK